MDLFGLGSMFGAIGDTIVGGMNYKAQKEALEEQKKQNQWQNQFAEKTYNEQFDFAKKQYDEQKQREDNAIQRRVADLEASGINKLMAAGQAANAGGMVGTTGAGSGGSGNFTAPQMQMQIQQSIDSIYNALKMTNDLAISDQQKKLIEAQVLGEYESQNLTREQREQLDAKKQEIIYNLDKSKNLGLRTTDAMNTNINTLIGATKTFKNELEDATEKSKESAKRTGDRIGGTIDPSGATRSGYNQKGGTVINGKRYGY